MVEDKELLKEAFGWSSAAPRWFRESQEKESLEDFLESAGEKLFYGIWGETFTALIRLNPCTQKVFEIDLFAKRGADLDLLATAGSSIKHYLYDRDIAAGFFGWIPRINRGVRKLYADLGFEFCGIRCFKGQAHHRPVEWLLMRSCKNG